MPSYFQAVCTPQRSSLCFHFNIETHRTKPKSSARRNNCAVPLIHACNHNLTTTTRIIDTHTVLHGFASGVLRNKWRPAETNRSLCAELRSIRVSVLSSRSVITGYGCSTAQHRAGKDVPLRRLAGSRATLAWSRDTD